MEKLMVTGGSGFIGGHLVRALRGSHVLVADVRSPGLPGVQFEKVNLEREVLDIRSGRGTRCVIHLAGRLGVERTVNDPIGTLNANINSTINVLEFCRKADVPKVLFSSSSEVYGDPTVVPTPETSPPQPKSAYGVSKLVCEEYVRAYSRMYGLKYVIIRYFNVYGPGQSTDFVVPQFVSAALRNKPLIVFGNGSSVRSFTYITDCVKGTLSAVESEQGENQIFNIGNDKGSITIKDLAVKIMKALRSQSNLRFLPMDRTNRKDVEIYRRTPSIKKARRILRYRPVVGLHDGILKTAEYFRRQS